MVLSAIPRDVQLISSFVNHFIGSPVAIYSAGLRLSELVRMRIHDIDVERGTVTVRKGKRDKHLVTVLPKSLREAVASQIERAREIWKGDREAGLARVHIAGAAARKFRKAAETFEWFWLFPARQFSMDPATLGNAGTSAQSEVSCHHHLHDQVYNEAIKRGESGDERAARGSGSDAHRDAATIDSFAGRCWVPLQKISTLHDRACSSRS